MNNNEMWMVTVDNVYSFDSLEKRSFLTLDEKEAKTYFKEMVKEYIKNELETVSDLLDRTFISLTEIIEYIEIVKEKYLPAYIDGLESEVHDIEYNYGLDVNKEKTYALFTISKHTKEIFDNNPITESFEEYYIMLQKVELGKEITNYGLPILDNVNEIDEILENL